MGSREWTGREPFLGSQAVASGAVTRGRLRGERFRRLFHVYVAREVPVTHVLRCHGAALVLPADAVLTGRSAAASRA